LAAYRHSLGLPAVSLAWGPWEQRSRITGRLDDTAWRRITRGGITPWPTGSALAELSAAITTGSGPVLAVLRVDSARLAGAGVPPLLAGLAADTGRRARPAATSTATPATLAAQLQAMTPAQQHTAVEALVRTHAAATLAYPSADAIDPAAAFTDLGFDSLTAVELRNRLTAATGLRLPATLVFDHPTPATLTRYVRSEILGPQDEEATLLAAFAGLEKVESSISQIVEDAAARTRVTLRLKSILSALNSAGESVNGEVADKIQSASDEEVFEFIDKQLGTP
jgi:acyl carrier protein